MLVYVASIDKLSQKCAGSKTQLSKRGVGGEGVENNRLLSVESVSQRLGVSIFTVRRLLKAEQLHGVRIAGRVLVPLDEIERVIKQGCGRHAKCT